MGANISSFDIRKKVVIANQDLSTIIKKQKNHGGWNDLMKECLTGPCKLINDDGSDATVMGPSGMIYRLNSELLVPFKSVKKHKIGSFVQLIQDEEEFKLLQNTHGEWKEDMRNILGKEVEVIQIFKDGDYKISHNNEIFIVHPKTIKSEIVENTELKYDDSDDSDDSNDRSLITDERTMRFLVALKTGNLSEVLRLVDSVGVNTKLKGIYPLLIAANEGHEDLVNLLLEKNANINIADKDGDTALHLAVHENRFKLCDLLLKKGADVNAQNNKKVTPTMIAALKGSQDILELLIISNNADLSIGDSDRDTALHLAVNSSRLESVEALLNAGADIYLLNKKLFNAYHLAAISGHEKILEIFLKRYGGKLVNSQKEDKFAAIHLLAMNNHEHCLPVLMKYKADLNLRNIELRTALHIAVKRKYLSFVKHLVENKAELDLKDKNGNTALHAAMKVNQTESGFGNFLKMTGALGVLGNIGEGLDKPEDIAIYLIENGASIDIKNNKGKTPLDICNDNSLKTRILSLVERDSQKHHITTKELLEHPVQPSDARSNEAELMELRQKLKEMEDEKICKICHDRRLKVIFECGHMCCDDCSDNISECHLCSEKILHKIKIN